MSRTIHAAAAELRQGLATPSTLLEECLARIESHESQVHAWVVIDADGAREQAERLTTELQNGQDRGPLHGIPLGIKDIIDVFDLPTAAGSTRWAHSVARRDATVVQRLRHAGAVILGKTVTTQFASFDPSPTRNPWNLERTPGGSSSGSAAAVACGMCLGAMGSQTGGSIARPAAYCGVAGCKPTYGRVSTEGILPLAPSMDHPGPIAHCVTDLALLFDTIAEPLAYALAYKAEGFGELAQPPRIGRLRGFFDVRAEESVRAMLDQVSATLTANGAEVLDLALPASFAELVARHHVIMAVEAATYHEVRLRRHPDDYLPNIRTLLEEGLACSATEYANCRNHQQHLTQELAVMLSGLDGFLTPATVGPAPSVETTGDPAFNSPWSYSGQPTISFPAGKCEHGMPLAIQLVGRHWEESSLFAVAAWCERALAVEMGEPPL